MVFMLFCCWLISKLLVQNKNCVYYNSNMLFFLIFCFISSRIFVFDQFFLVSVSWLSNTLFPFSFFFFVCVFLFIARFFYILK